MKFLIHLVVAVSIPILITPLSLVADQSPAPDNEKSEIGNLVPRDGSNKFNELPIKKGKFMFSVSLHKEQEIDSLLTRADELSKVMRTNGNDSRIALILHGPEVRFFTKKAYISHRTIVDRARRLNDGKIIEIKICKSKMDEYGIDNAEIPSFVEIIPYAPDEEKRLLTQGYVYF